MELQTFEAIKQYFEQRNTLQSTVFNLLKDCDWHCRNCEGTMVASGQYAGGGGIQGLERGTKTRAGLVILSKNRPCSTCKAITMHDRLTGETKQSNAPSNISKILQKKILNYFDYTDVIEDRKRTADKLVIDHKLPMERWGKNENFNNNTMSNEEIEKKFQLLKKDDGGNHNLLKSRSCEKCISTGLRGYPLGIKYWYTGDENWPKNVPSVGLDAEAGCYGCGWYDLKTWRMSLNTYLADNFTHKGLLRG